MRTINNTPIPVRGVFVTVSLLWVLAVFVRPARAWERVPYEDAEVVERSELIVVGGIEKDSIRYVPHAHGLGEGASWEHHAMLRVSRVIKGKCDEKQIPIVIHYGLEPLIDGHAKNENSEVNLAPAAGAPAGAVQIMDTGDLGGIDPAVPDARADNLWFLRRRSGNFGREPGNGDYGIVDPQDLQPLALESYFVCYLAADPESAIRKQMGEHPAVALRATRYLERQHLLRLIKTADPAERVERLLPYYGDRGEWGLSADARRAIVATGSVAGPYLLAVYQSARDLVIRDDVVRDWADIRWPGCVDLLIDRLKEDDRFWAVQKLTPGWWNDSVEPLLTQRRRDVYGEVYSAVCALARIGDPKAKEAIELTRRRWAGINFENPQIVEECDRALQQFAGAAPR